MDMYYLIFGTNGMKKMGLSLFSEASYLWPGPVRSWCSFFTFIMEDSGGNPVMYLRKIER
jgi:hypothetical protein